MNPLLIPVSPPPPGLPPWTYWVLIGIWVVIIVIAALALILGRKNQ